MNRLASTLAIAVLIVMVPARLAAVEKCKVKINAKDGSLEVSASAAAANPRWGDTAGAATNVFADAATCVANDKLKKCHLGAPGTAARLTPPPLCTLHLADDGPTDCTAYVKGCTPGVRAGASGSDVTYGDGSAGARTISADDELLEGNLQFTDFTVDPGVNLLVQSGTVIRCTGTFSNAGTIVVRTAAQGGALADTDAGAIDASNVAPHPGLARRAAGNGELGSNSADRSGGARGIQMSGEVLHVRHALYGGGGGGAAVSFNGGNGGGALTVLAATAIVNVGAIQANGAEGFGAGAGGGAGGVVLLASKGSVTLSPTGEIGARGADGRDSGASAGPGGGGGGGLVHLLAPSITLDGVTDVGAGVPGALGLPGSIGSGTRAGGGGGGACAGRGGAGGGVTTGGDPQAAEAGSDGVVLQTLADPTSLF